MNILWRNVFEIHIIHLCANLHIAFHTWRSNNIVHLPVWVTLQLIVTPRTSRDSAVTAGADACIYLSYPLYYLKETRSTCYAVCLQRRRDSKAYRLLCT